MSQYGRHSGGNAHQLYYKILFYNVFYYYEPYRSNG